VAKERPRVTFPQLVRALSGSFPHMARSLGVGLIAFVILVLAAALGGLGGFLIAVVLVLAAFWVMRHGGRRGARD
jgi:hypothetical protein